MDGIIKYVFHRERPFVLNRKQPTETDAWLIRRVLKGERNAYALLMKRYQKLVYTIAYRMTGRVEDAEDLTQECFLRAYTALSRFRTEQGFGPWISRIISNLCLNWIDKKKRELPATDDALDNLSVDPRRSVETNELQMALQEAILRLPSRHRLVFTLRYLEGHDCRQIAQIMEIPEGTVKTYLFRARQKLQKQLRHFWHGG